VSKYKLQCREIVIVVRTIVMQVWNYFVQEQACACKFFSKILFYLQRFLLKIEISRNPPGAFRITPRKGERIE